MHGSDEWAGGGRLAGPLEPPREKAMTGNDLLELREEETDRLADGLGANPEQLDGGCDCDRPRWNLLPCGHCACQSACNDCAANKLWRDEQDAWCGCAEPGRNGVLACGHCACAYGCFEHVRGDSDAPMQRAPCAV